MPILLILLLLASFPDALPAAPLQRPSVKVVMAEYVAQAQKLLAEGKAEEAWAMLASAVREEPDNVAINVLMVQAAFATKRDNQALAALERLVAIHPEDAGIHYNLAKAYSRAGDDAAAASELEEALRINPNIAKEIDGDEKAGKPEADSGPLSRLKTAGRLATGYVWDSNATGGVDDLEVAIGPFTFELPPEAGKKAASGEYVNGSLNWGWRLGENSSWLAAGDLGFYGKKYETELPSNQHFTWSRAALGLRNLGERHFFDIKGSVENSYYDPFESMTSWGGEASFVYALFPNFQIIGRGGLESRAYMEYESRDGLYWNAGGYARLLLNNGKWAAMAGMRAIGGDAREKNNSYDGYDALFRFELNFLEKLDVSPFLGWRKSYYRDSATALSKLLGEGYRTDDTFMGGCGLTWNWTEHIGTEFNWQYIKNYSTSPFYKYSQHQINMGMVFSF